MRHIFVVDDDREIRELLRKYLEKEGYKVTLFHNGDQVVGETRRLGPDLIVLDIMMPGMDGIGVCQEIRRTSDTPIFFISARGEEVDRIIGLELGADDYMAKPFSPRELLVRIKNMFKRMDKMKTSTIEKNYPLGNTMLMTSNRILQINGKPIKLTNKEYKTISLLVINPNQAFSREQIIEKVWGYDDLGEGRLVDDVVKRLRKKLKDHKSDIEIQTVWGFGYKIES